MGAILAATPAVQVSTFEVGSNGTGPGPAQRVWDVGVQPADRRGANVSGILLTGLTLNYGSFEEVSVGTAAHSAEWPVLGVQMQFIVKSGGNRYSGTLYADGAFRRLQSFNIDSRQLPDDVRERWRACRPATPIGSGVPTMSTRMLGGYVRKDRSRDGSVRNQDISARQVNFPVRPVVTRLTNYSAKTTFSLNDRHRLVGYGHVGWEPATCTHSLHSVLQAPSTRTPPSIARKPRRQRSTHRAGSGKAQWNATLASNLFAEVAVGQFGNARPEEPNGAGPRFEDIDTLDRQRRQSSLAVEPETKPGVWHAQCRRRRSSRTAHHQAWRDTHAVHWGRTSGAKGMTATCFMCSAIHGRVK